MRRLLQRTPQGNQSVRWTSTVTSTPKRGKRRNYLDGDDSGLISPQSSEQEDAFHFLNYNNAVYGKAKSANNKLSLWRRWELKTSIYLLHTRLIHVVYFHYLKAMAFASYLFVGNKIRYFSRTNHASDGVRETDEEDPVYVGKSAIHGRGIFAARDLKRGTRIHFSSVDHAAPGNAGDTNYYIFSKYFLKFSLDFQQDETKLPEMFHYYHPSGNVLQLNLNNNVVDLLLNHSCTPNCASGFSAFFLDHVLNDSALKKERRTFRNPNHYYLTRDVQQGEEITINYSARLAPMTFADRRLFTSGNGKSQRTGRKRALLSGVQDTLSVLFSVSGNKSHNMVCRCGEENCNHFVYKYPEAVLKTIRKRYACTDGETRANDMALLRELIEEHQFDNEFVLLSLLPSSDLLFEYLNSPTTATPRDKNENRFEFYTITKSELIKSYRNAFKVVNEITPQGPAKKEEKW
ncbi:hypothetical protein AGDE_16171 [Angomonas deanei]|uniref:SET domain containing protein, putative n=1 Tax=Angomonas deanei TaxID=59799 RepID=A0A7G2C1W1_9TRYP|nr:hypothetical protein AGDE_16171 [Angomonas deanei]CAD2213626.1 SET domain containing protein, putative [Angomonas deanei]|eukprot:EPY17590.1 hypothetical protein AGDE_16171 [Angomonas deanei]